MESSEQIPEVTLVIPTHNRHPYLNRILDYYELCPFRIVIVDSSRNAFPGTYNPIKCLYIHSPDELLTSKIVRALNLVDTKYAFMCADDDFIVPQRVMDCIQFLKENPSYAAAQGNFICYKKQSTSLKSIDFNIVYKENLSLPVDMDDPLDRIAYFLKNYRSFFYAVHYTENLRLAFYGAEQFVTNLYINEYLSAIPLMVGKYKLLPFLYQVREYSSTSDDKTTPNLDAVFDNPPMYDQFENLMRFFSEKMAKVKAQPGLVQNYYVKLNNMFIPFARSLQETKSKNSMPANKKIGKFISYLPVIGKYMIGRYRHWKKKKEVSMFIQTKVDSKAIMEIQRLILKHINVIQ